MYKKEQQNLVRSADGFPAVGEPIAGSQTRHHHIRFTVERLRVRVVRLHPPLAERKRYKEDTYIELAN